MKTINRLILLSILASMGLSSCRYLNPSVMMRTKRGYAYAPGQDTLPQRYFLQKGDLITFRLYANQGFKIIDLTTVDDGNANMQRMNNLNTFTYLIEPDSTINLPIIGRVVVAGMNLTDAELFLEDRYRNYYNDPFIMLTVRNRRITVFPGEGGAAKVIPIENEQISLIEALALAGGISAGGKAHRVKVIRGDFENPEIFFIDLRRPETFAESNIFYVRANDIIYVEPSYFVGKQILSTTTQILSVLTSVIVTTLLVINVTTQ